MNEEEAIERMNDLIHTCDVGIKKHGDYDDLFQKDKEAIETVLNLIEKQKAEIEYWKEQAQGYSDLSKQIKEEYEQRLEDYYNEE